MPGAVDKSFEPTHEQVILFYIFYFNIFQKTLISENIFYVNFKKFHLI